jgi:predicted transcriptional regulator
MPPESFFATTLAATKRKDKVLDEQAQSHATAEYPATNSNLDLIVSIVSAYVSNNSLRMADLPELIASVHTSISNLMSSETKEAAPPKPAEPAVPIKKSIMPDYIICLEDGKKFRSLKRHIGTAYNLTPDQYREKWGLPPDYPMVAPAYSAIRSKLARDIGLGQQRNADASAEAPAPVEAPAAKTGRAKRSAA